MPPVRGNLDNGLLDTINDLSVRLRAVESQMNATYCDVEGRPVMNIGQIPGVSPNTYGIQFLDPDLGVQRCLLAYVQGQGFTLTFDDDTGASAVTLGPSGLAAGGVTVNASGVDAGGVTLTSSGLAAGGVTVNSSGLTAGPVSLTSAGLAAGGGVEVNANGLEVFNGTTLEVQAGKLNSSPDIYGIGVRPYNGSQLQQVGGMLNTQASAATNVTNTTAAAFGGASSITCEIGPSGQALVSAQCQVSTGTGGQNGAVVVRVDGGSWFTFLNVSTSASGGTTVEMGSTFPWTGLTAGTHTFQIGYVTGANGTATVSFAAPTLTVQPL